MRKQSILSLFGLLITTLVVQSCFFDEQADATPWLKNQGVESLADAKVSVFENIIPLKMSTGLDSTPTSASLKGSIGSASGTEQSLFLQLTSVDTASLNFARTADSVSAYIRMGLDSSFYLQHAAYTTFPVSDSIKLQISWKFKASLTQSVIDSLRQSASADWYLALLEVLRGKTKWNKSDTTYTLQLSKNSQVLDLPIPSALLKEMQAAKGNYSVDLKVNFANANRVYRVLGPGVTTGTRPYVLLKGRTQADTAIRNYVGLADTSQVWVRMAQAGVVTESCLDCIALHGGVNESLVVELPTDAIWSALQKSLPKNQLDSIMVDDMVLLAVLELANDTQAGGSELGKSIPLLSYGYLDSITLEAAKLTSNRITEPRRIDTLDIQKNGRSNLLFFAERDTLALQITQTFRHWLQVGRYAGTKLQVGMRMNWLPVLEPKDYRSASYVNNSGDSVKIYSDHVAYSKWNIGEADALRMRLRVWLAERR